VEKEDEMKTVSYTWFSGRVADWDSEKALNDLELSGFEIIQIIPRPKSDQMGCDSLQIVARRVEEYHEQTKDEEVTSFN